MLTHEYSYAACLEGSIKNAWTVEDCYQGRDFDFAKPFLPERMAGVSAISCLHDEEQRWLNQIRGNSFCHLFAVVEEYIVPMVMASAAQEVYGDETRLWSLVRFAEEEIKHQQLMGRACDQFAAGFGAPCGLIPGRETVAEVVLGRSELTALLLTSMIEWFTQLHYVEHVRGSQSLDPHFRDLLKFHWIDESRHARLDSLLIDEVARRTTPKSASKPSTRCSSSAARSTASSPNRSSSTSGPWPPAPGEPSPPPSIRRFAPPGNAGTAGPSSCPGSHTRNSPRSSPSSPTPGAPRSPKPPPPGQSDTADRRYRRRRTPPSSGMGGGPG